MSNIPYALDYAPAFKPVADVFRKSFEDGHELGASFAIYKNCLLYTSPSPRDRG